MKVFSSPSADNPQISRNFCVLLSIQARFIFHHEKSKPMNQKNCVEQHKSNTLVRSQRNKSNSQMIAKTEKTSCASVGSQRLLDSRGNLNNHQTLRCIYETFSKLPKERISGRRVQVDGTCCPLIEAPNANSSKKTSLGTRRIETTCIAKNQIEWNITKVLAFLEYWQCQHPCLLFTQATVILTGKTLWLDNREIGGRLMNYHKSLCCN
jgi:hypothetical protein